MSEAIPAQAVEAAAKELYELQIGQTWGDKPEWVAVYEGYATAALEAAAPYMQGQVTTRVEQVNLPNNTVVLSAKGDVLQHFNGYWFAPGSSYRHHLDEVALPATVLHKGAAL